VTTAIAVAVLALFDALLAGIRCALGRDGAIDKRPYLRRAFVTAVASGVVVVAANVALVAILVATAPDPHASWAAFERAGTTCIYVFGAFATVTLAALLFWVSPDPDYRVLATVIVLGPLTLVRPVVIAGGLALAIAGSSDPRVWIAAVVAGASMLAFEHFLGRAHATRWRRLVGEPPPR
jgi:hypothetical protein